MWDYKPHKNYVPSLESTTLTNAWESGIVIQKIESGRNNNVLITSKRRRDVVLTL